MRKILCIVLLSGLAFILNAGIAMAVNTQAEAEAMAKKTVDFYKANGLEKTVEALNDPHSGFMEGELYSFLFDLDVNCLGHPANPKLVGKNLSDLKDAEGKTFMKDMAEKAKAGGGWIDYKWSNPETRKLQDKSTFVIPIQGTNLFVGCGIYK